MVWWALGRACVNDLSYSCDPYTRSCFPFLHSLELEKKINPEKVGFFPDDSTCISE